MRLSLAFLGAALAVTPACGSTEARVIRFAARERGCTEPDTRILARVPPSGWRLNVCGTERLYAEAGGRVWEIPPTSPTPALATTPPSAIAEPPVATPPATDVTLDALRAQAATEHDCGIEQISATAIEHGEVWFLVCGVTREYLRGADGRWHEQSLDAHLPPRAPPIDAASQPSRSEHASCPGGVTTSGRCCTTGCACGGSCIDCSRRCHH